MRTVFTIKVKTTGRAENSRSEESVQFKANKKEKDKVYDTVGAKIT